jgi:O-antigen/teichoic acid export membrane protein
MILKSLKQIGKHSFTYSLNYIISSLAGILLLPIYTRYLSSTDYGILSLIDQSIYYLKIVIFLGGSAAVTRFYHYFESEKDKKLVISTGMWLALISSGIGSIFLLVGSKPLASIIFGNSDKYILIFVAAIILSSESLISVSMSYFAAIKDSKSYVAYGIFQLTLGILANLYFIIFLRLGAVGMIYGQALSNTIMCLITSTHVLFKNSINFDSNKCKSILKYGLPIVPATILAAMMHSADQFLVRFFLGLDAVGIYSLGYKIAFSAYSVFSVSINLVWSSAIIFDVYKQPNAKEIYSKLTTYISSVLILLMFCVSMFSADVVKLLASPEYYDSQKIIPVVCLGLVAYGLQTFISVGLVLNNRTDLFIVTNGIAAIVNVLVNLALIPSYGYMGAAWASVVTYVTFGFASWVIYRKIYDIPFEWLRLATLLGSCILMYIFSIALPIQNALLLTAYKISLCLALPCILYGTGFINKQEKVKIEEWRLLIKQKSS